MAAAALENTPVLVSVPSAVAAPVASAVGGVTAWCVSPFSGAWAGSGAAADADRDVETAPASTSTTGGAAVTFSPSSVLPSATLAAVAASGAVASGAAAAAAGGAAATGAGSTVNPRSCVTVLSTSWCSRVNSRDSMDVISSTTLRRQSMRSHCNSYSVASASQNWSSSRSASSVRPSVMACSCSRINAFNRRRMLSSWLFSVASHSHQYIMHSHSYRSRRPPPGSSASPCKSACHWSSWRWNTCWHKSYAAVNKSLLLVLMAPNKSVRCSSSALASSASGSSSAPSAPSALAPAPVLPGVPSPPLARSSRRWS